MRQKEKLRIGDPKWLEAVKLGSGLGHTYSFLLPLPLSVSGNHPVILLQTESNEGDKMEKKRNWNREGRMEEIGRDRNCRQDCLPRLSLSFSLSASSHSFLNPVSFPHRPAPENIVLFPLFQMPSKGAYKWAECWWGCYPKRGGGGRIFQYLCPSSTTAKEEGRHRSFRLMNFHRNGIVDLTTPNLKDPHFNRVLPRLGCRWHSCSQYLKQSFMCVPPACGHCLSSPQEGDRSEMLKIKIYTSLLNAKTPLWDMPRSRYIHFK